MTMRLIDLEATFINHRVGVADSDHGRPLPDGSVQWGGFPVDQLHEQAEFTGSDGVEFLCPKCFQENGGPRGTHLVQVFFAGSDAPDHLGRDSEGRTARWSAAGTSLDDLTLSPSVWVRTGCGWHGWVQNGEARDC